MAGEYDNGKGYRFYGEFYESEKTGTWWMDRYLGTLPELTDCSEYCATLIVKDKQTLIDALESSIFLPLKLYCFLTRF